MPGYDTRPQLDRIEKRLERIERALMALLDEAGVEETGPACGHCGSADVIEDTCFGEARRVACRDCNQATTIAKEAANG